MPATTRKGTAAASAASRNNSRSISGTPAPEGLKRKKSTPATKNAQNKRQQTPEPPCDPDMLKKVLEYHSRVTNTRTQSAKDGNAPTDEIPSLSELLTMLIILQLTKSYTIAIQQRAAALLEEETLGKVCDDEEDKDDHNDDDDEDDGDDEDEDTARPHKRTKNPIIELDDDEAALAAGLDGPEYDVDVDVDVDDHNKNAKNVNQDTDAEAEIDEDEDEDEELSGSFRRQQSYFEGNGVMCLLTVQ